MRWAHEDQQMTTFFKRNTEFGTDVELEKKHHLCVADSALGNGFRPGYEWRTTDRVATTCISVRVSYVD